MEAGFELKHSDSYREPRGYTAFTAIMIVIDTVILPGGRSFFENSLNLMPSNSGIWRRKWQPTAVFLPGEFHGQRSLAGYSPWGCRVGHDTHTCNSGIIHPGSSNNNNNNHRRDLSLGAVAKNRTGVQSLVRKDSTCCGATESEGLEPLLCNKRPPQ